MKNLLFLFCLFAAPVMADTIYPVQVVSVYDGDTFTADVAIWPGLTVRTSVRVLGIDSAEIRTTNACEKQIAIAARDYAATLLNSGVVTIANVAPDKYGGRVDADVFVASESYAAVMIKAGRAKPYDGGARQPWCI
jgi:micrococcal nuclease